MIDLRSNESPLAPPESVRAAIAAEIGNLNRYPARQDEALPAALAARFGRGLTPGHFLPALSGSDVLELIGRAHLAPGDEAIITSPTFPVYARTIRLLGATLVDVPLRPGSFEPDVDRIVAAVTPRTRLVFLCNPGNPTGVILPAAATEHLLDRLPPSVLTVIDEVYHHFVSRSDFPDAVGAVLAGRRAVVVHSFSKAYGLAGLRLGYAIAEPELITAIGRHRRDYHLSRLHVAGGLAALEARDYIRELVALVDEGRRYLAGELGRLGLHTWPSQTNFVLVRAPGDARELQQALQARGILVRTTDGNGLPGHLRVTVGLPGENRAFVEALAEVLRSA